MVDVLPLIGLTRNLDHDTANWPTSQDRRVAAQKKLAKSEAKPKTSWTEAENRTVHIEFPEEQVGKPQPVASDQRKETSAASAASEHGRSKFTASRQ